MRDSQSLLDQLLASSPGTLTAEHVTTVLGTAGDDRVIDLASAILANDPKTALELIGAWVDRGLQVGELVDQLIEYWRALMLVSCGGPDVRELPVTPNQYEAVKKHVPLVKLDGILGGLEVLTATKTRMRGSTHTQVLLEMAVVRLCRLGELLSVGELVQRVQAFGATGVALPATANGTPAPQAPRNGVSAPESGGAKKNDLTAARPAGTSSSNGELSTVPLTESTLHDVWARFLQYAGEKYPILAKHLSFSSSHANFGPNSLVIRFPTAYSDAREACAAEANAQRIQDALRRVTGQTVAVKFETDATAAARTPSGPSAPAPPPTDRKRSLAALPLFKKASEALGAQIWHVDDDFNPTAPPRTNKDRDSGANTDGE
jgi:DNA polymerase-3 subunit gamma/tau